MVFSFFFFFSWKITSEGIRLGSFLNLTGSQGQKFVQHITTYRGVLLSVSRGVQPSVGRLVVALTQHLCVHRHSAMLMCDRGILPQERIISVPWPLYLTFFTVFVYVYDTKKSYKTSKLMSVLKEKN